MVNGKGKGKASEPTEPESQAEEEPEDLRNITIIVQGYENIEAAFSATDVMCKIQYKGMSLGESDKIPVTDDAIQETYYEAEIFVNVQSGKDLDDLINYPIYFTVIQSAGVMDMSHYSERQDLNPNLATRTSMTVDSAFNLFEAITGEVGDRMVTMENASTDALTSASTKNLTGKKDSKSTSKSNLKKESKTSASSKSMKTQGSKEKFEKKEAPNEIVMGSCALDMLPFLLGQEEIHEALLVYQVTNPMDETMVTFKNLPKLHVRAVIDKPIFDEERKLSNIIYFTIESMYNLPEEIKPFMTYKAATILPVESSTFTSVVIENGTYTNERNLDNMKKWSSLSHLKDYSGMSKYCLTDENVSIKNKLNVDLDKAFSEDMYRVEWNVLRRGLFTDEALNSFVVQLTRYRCIPLEIYITPSEVPIPDDKAATDKKKKEPPGSSKASLKSKTSVGAADTDKLHLMAFIDISKLLYPGVTKCRVVSQVMTYQSKEIKEKAGLADSFFVPAVPADEEQQADEKDKGGKKDKDKDSKKSKGKDKKEPELKVPEVAQPEPEPEPSRKLFAANGQPTFIIIEVELMKAFQPKREIEDITDDLRNLVPERPGLPKAVISARFSQKYFRECIKQIAAAIHLEYSTFIKQCEVSQNCGDYHGNFVQHLQTSGVYHYYLSTLKKTVATTVSEKFEYKGDKATKDYQNFISNVYVYLVNEMNIVLNGLFDSGTETPHTPEHDPQLYYAKEAEGIGALELADRYYLERIGKNDKDPGVWFTYAVHQIEFGSIDKAFECLQEALSINLEHKYSLLLYAILLADKKSNTNAELCFQKLLYHHPNFVEGWVALHFFYLDVNNLGGADYAEEMAMKSYTDTDGGPSFVSTDLNWYTNMCPNRLYFVSALLFIEIRAANYAEKALTVENIEKSGVNEYYMAVNLYILQDYWHAIAHLDEAVVLYGPCYQINSLLGHCYYHLGFFKDAKEVYSSVVESYNRPDDLHLLHVNLASIFEKEGNATTAKKLLLLACKYSPTPYTWLAVGIIFLQNLDDLVTAEDCLNEANILDNRLAEVWGYLALLNIKLNQRCDADQCYKQALKNDLKDQNLLDKLTEAIKDNKLSSLL